MKAIKLVLLLLITVLLSGVASAAFNDSISFLWQMDASNAELIRSTSTVLNSGAGYGGYSNITGKVGSGAYSITSGSSVKTSTFQPVINTSRSNFTLAFWFRFNATSDFNANKGIIGTDLCPAYAVRVVEKQKSTGTSSGMEIGFWDSGCAWLAPSFTGNFTPETWYWIVVSYNSLPNGSSQKLYRDGSLINETSYTGALLVVNNTFNWGSLTSSSANFKLDQLTIMNRSVTDAEVTSWWNASNGCQNPGLCVDGVPTPIIPYANFTNITSEIPQLNFSMPNSSTFTIIDDTPTFWVTALDETGTLSNCIASTTNTTIDGMLNYTYVKGQVISNRCGITWNQSLGYGTTTTFYIGLNSSSGISTTAINSTNNYFTVYTQLPSPPNVTFVTSNPADITSTNLFGGKYNATWSVNDSRFAINLSSVVLYHQVNNTLITDASATCRIIINGTPECGYQTDGVVIYNTTTDGKNVRINTVVDENEILPATYVLEDEVTDDTQHSPKTFDQNSIYSTTILNVSSIMTYGWYEIMINKTGTGGSSAQVWYCNSSYTTGTITTNTNCFNFGVLLPTTTYNHTHTDYSSHQLIPFVVNTTSGRIGTVGISPTSYFILRTTTGPGTWQSWAVSNISRVNTTRSSNNTGTSWSNAAFTMDTHLHQFGPATYYQEYLCASNNKTSNNCSTVHNDNLNLSNIPPTSPSITYPAFNQTLEAAVTTNITWNPSISAQGYNITYNVSIYNNSILLQNVVTSTTQNTISWNPAYLGPQQIVIVAKDSTGLTSTGIRTVQVADTTPPTNYIYIPLNNSKSTTSLNNITYLTNDTYSTIMTCPIFDNAVPLTIQTAANGTNKTFQSNLSDGQHLIEIICNDESGNVGNLVSTNFTIDTTAPTFSNFSTTPASPMYINNPLQKYINITINDTSTITTVTADLRKYDNTGGSAPIVNNDGSNYYILGEPSNAYKYNLTFFANDSFGNSATSSIYEVIAYSNVTVTLNEPANNSAQANSTITFNWTTTSVYPTETNCTLTVDGIVNGTFPSNNNNSIVQINFTDGSHRWNVTCTNGYTNTTSQTNEVITNINGVVLQVYNGLTNTILRTWSATVDGVTYNTTLFGTSISLPLTYYKGVNLSNATFFPSCTRGMVTDTDPTCGFFNTTTTTLYTATYTNTTVNQTLINFTFVLANSSYLINTTTITLQDLSLTPQSTSTGVISTPTGTSTRTYSISGTGFPQFNQTFTFNPLDSYILQINISNSSTYLTINILDEDTNQSTPEQFNILYEGETYSAVNNGTGSITTQLFTPDKYKIHYSSASYPSRIYYIELTGLSGNNITAYALNETRSTSIKITIEDENGNPLEKALVKAYRFYPSTNSYLPVEMELTNNLGQSGFHLVIPSNTQAGEYYKFIVEYPINNVRLMTNPGLVFGDQTFKINIYDDYLASFKRILANTSATYNLSFNNATKTFSFVWNDNTGIIREGCLRVIKMNNTARTIINETCQTGSSGIVLASSGSDGLVIAEGIIDTTTTTSSYIVAQLTQDFSRLWENIGKPGVFYQVLLTLTASFALIWGPEAALIGIAGSFVLGSVLGLMSWGWTALLTMILLAGIAIWRMRS